MLRRPKSRRGVCMTALRWKKKKTKIMESVLFLFFLVRVPVRVLLSCPAVFSSQQRACVVSPTPSLRPLSSRTLWQLPRWSADQVSMLCFRGQRSAAAVPAAGPLRQWPPPPGGSGTTQHQVDCEPPVWVRPKKKRQKPASSSASSNSSPRLCTISSVSLSLLLATVALCYGQGSGPGRGQIWISHLNRW